jgi:hypothetical protein
MIVKANCDCCGKVTEDRYTWDDRGVSGYIFLVCYDCQKVLTMNLEEVQQHLSEKVFHDMYHDVAFKKYQMRLKGGN